MSEESSVNRHLICFQVLLITNKAAVKNVHDQSLYGLTLPFLLSKYPADHRCILNILVNC